MTVASNATISPSLVNAAANNNTRSVLWSVVDDLALDIQQARQQQPSNIIINSKKCVSYSQILSDCRGGASENNGSCTSSAVLLVCSPNVDALATDLILVYMLRNDGVSCHLLPCRDYRQY